MDLLTVEKVVELSHVKTFIDALSNVTNIDPSAFSIMGGHSRRLYMLTHDISMHENDIASWSSSDIDIFCDIKCVIDDKTLSFIKNLSDDPNYDFGIHEVPPSAYDALQVPNFDTDDDRYARLRDILKGNESGIKMIDSMVRKHVIEFIEKIKTLFDEDAKQYLFVNHVHKGCSDLYQYTTTEKVYIGDLFENLNVDDIVLMAECAISNTLHHDPSFKVSSKHISFTIPLGKIQLIFNNTSNNDSIDSFDIPQSKFKLDYPYCVDDVVYFGKESLPPDNFYYIETMTMRNISPFRLSDRLHKYGSYGFLVSPNVIEEFHKHIDVFVDNNPIQSCVTYTSSLY